MKHDPNDTRENRVIGFTGGWVDLSTVPMEQRWRNLPAERASEAAPTQFKNRKSKKGAPALKWPDYPEIIAQHFQSMRVGIGYGWKFRSGRNVSIVKPSPMYMIAQKRLCKFISANIEKVNAVHGGKWSKIQNI